METSTASIPAIRTPVGDEKIWGMLGHLTSFIGLAFILALTICLVS